MWLQEGRVKVERDELLFLSSVDFQKSKNKENNGYLTKILKYII